MNTLFRTIRKPAKGLAVVWRTVRRLLKKKGVLVYLGLNRGGAFDDIFRDYKTCYGFEAEPELFAELKKRYERYPHVHLFHAAVATYDGTIAFNVSSNDAMSSSIGSFREDWGNFRSGHVVMVKRITVPCVNLYTFLRARGIDYIDDYISDIQGMDLEVLRTMKAMTDKKRIGTIQCEVAKNEKGNIYGDLPDNSEQGFQALLSANYELVARGWGVLRDGQLDVVPKEWWEMDCKWRVK